MGTGDLSDKIRTYNWPNDRVTDHWINVTKFGIADMLSGKLLDEFIDELRVSERNDIIKAILES